MRIADRAILALHLLSGWIDGFTDTPHLTTDPVCVRHQRVKEGSRLDRASRGVGCTPCMVKRAFGGDPS